VARLVAAATTGAGAVVSGDRGSGRRTVVAAAADRLAEAGVPVLAVAAGTEAGEPEVPLAALRPVLPEAPPAVVDAATLAAVGEALVARGARIGPGRPVVVARDLDTLDGPSTAVLHQLLVAGRVALLGTASDEPAPAPTASAPAAAPEAWWRDLVDRVHLDALDRAPADRLLEALVGGPVDSAGRERMWAFARGHPGRVVAVVEATRAEGTWERSSGLWSLVGELDDLVDAAVLAEVDRAPAEVGAALAALALAGRLPIAAAEALGGPAALADAERRGLVVAEDDDDGRLWCRPASDLVATAARAGLDATTTMARWGRVAEVLAAEPPTDPDVAIVRALALAGRSPGPADLAGARPPLAAADVAALVAGAEAAYLRSRWDVAATLAERAWREGRGGDAVRVLAQAYAQLGDHDGIRRLGAELEGAAVAPEDAVHHAETIAVSQFHLADAAGAWATFARARAATPPAARSPVDLAESRLRSFAGQQEEAAVLARRWAGDPDAEVRSEALQVLGSVALNEGRFEDAMATFDQAVAEALSLPDPLPALLGVPYLFRLSACTDLGRLDEALEGGLAVEPEVAASNDPTAHGWLALHLGRTALAAGRPVTAARWFGESVNDLRRVHRPGWLGFPAAGLVAAHTVAGDLAAATEARARWLAIPAHSVSLFRTEELRLDAVHRAAVGDAAGADACAREAATSAAANGSVPYEAHALHALSRVGRPTSRAEAAAGLERLARSSDSPLFAAHALRARAMADSDVEGLVAVAPAYEAMGARLDAVECWAEVARRPADDRQRAHARRRVAELRADGEPLVTPALDGVGSRPVLTAREAEIASLVAAGTSRQDIADHLVVSVRTIDSHLQRVYRKLGVRGREGLVAALGADPPAGVAGGP